MGQATEILEMMLKALPPGQNGVDFCLSQKIYKDLCKELKRNVRTYKRHKVYAYNVIETDKAYLTTWPHRYKLKLNGKA